jgi:hypothetical protein
LFAAVYVAQPVCDGKQQFHNRVGQISGIPPQI